jgi:hypothetical protein
MLNDETKKINQLKKHKKKNNPSQSTKPMNLVMKSR